MVMGKGKMNTNISYSKVDTILGIDKRALALFRVSLGAIGIYDMYERWPDIKAHYSDEGILPRSVVLDNYWNQSWFSIHMMAGSINYMKALFVVNMIVCFLMMVGYRSRLMTFLNWFFIISIQARNNVVGHGGDVYMRLICYFGLFLPLGSVFSVDSALKYPHLRRVNKRFTVVNVATIAMILQISFLYVFSYLHKTGDEWRVDHTASFYALQLDYFRTFLADFILHFPNILKFFTWAVLYYEGFGMLACCFPLWTNQIKTIGALGFSFLHIGFGSFMRLGIFSPICTTGTLLLYPTWFWDQIYARLRRNREWSDFRIYYQTKMGYYIAGLVSTFLLLPDVEVGPLPSNFEEESVINLNTTPGNPTYNPLLDNNNRLNWVVTRDHKSIRYTGFKAFTSILRASPLLWPLYSLLDHPTICYYGKRMFEGVEGSVYLWEDWGGNKSLTSSYLPNVNAPSDEDPSTFILRKRPLSKRAKSLKLSKKFLLNAFAGLSIIAALGWNCNTVSCGVDIGLSEKYTDLVLSLRMDQMWSMFSPRPPAVHWWYTFEGELDDGTGVELWNNQGLYTWEGNIAPYTTEKPDPYAPCIGNHRWFKIYENLNTGAGFEIIRLGLGRWICREWNARHEEAEEKLYKFNIVYRNEKQNLDNTRTLLPEIVLWSHYCYDKGKV